MKVLISVLSLNKEPYIGLEKTIRETWASESREDVEVIYYYGDSNEIKLIGDRLFLDSSEGLMGIGYKTLKMYEYVLENFTFDYIFRTNSSSYVNIEKLLDFIENKPKEKFYSGVIGKYGGFNFASGSGYFISKDLVDLVVRERNKWDHNLIDDVSLGKLMSENNVKIYRGNRVNLTTMDKIIPEGYHYRIKHPLNRNNDIIMLKKIHNKYANKQTT